jgi:subtilisin family serine protease
MSPAPSAAPPYGVAKGVTLHPVRVLNCSGSGTNSGVIAGMDWVTANHVKPAVANMSWAAAPAPPPTTPSTACTTPA